MAEVLDPRGTRMGTGIEIRTERESRGPGRTSRETNAPDAPSPSRSGRGVPYGCGKADGSAARGFALGMSGASITSGLHWVSCCRGLGVCAGRKPRRRIMVCSCRWVPGPDWAVVRFRTWRTIWCGNGAVCGGWRWRRGRGKGTGGVHGMSSGCPRTAHEPSRVVSRLPPAENTRPRFAPRRVSIVT